MNYATNLLLCSFLWVGALLGTAPEQKQWEEYLQLMQDYLESIGWVGDAERGEIELLKDPEKIVFAMQKTGRDVGILYQDRYWIWLNDPLKFPSGNIGVCGRIVPRASLRGAAGCAVLARREDGKFAFICTFRHATRSWELEIPRGIRELGETPEESAKRELLEETGLVADELVSLGEMAPDTGESGAVLAAFFAVVKEEKSSKPEDSEAIASVIFLTEQELWMGLKNGWVKVLVKGGEQKIFLRDPFLTFSLVQMQVRGLFSWTVS